MSADQKEPDDKEQDVEDMWAEAMQEQAQAESSADTAENVQEQAQAPHDEAAEEKNAEKNGQSAAEKSPEKAAFDDLQNISPESMSGDEIDGKSLDTELDVILDIPVTISMEIGRTRLPIRNLLRLNQGSVVELDRLAGEPLDVLVNGTLIAHGEVVLINDKYGIRLTDVISPQERVRKLK